MNIEELMTSRVASCRVDDSLSRAAELMWNRDCGWVPVVDDSERLLGVVTDRDVCMGAWTKNRVLHEIQVQEVMSAPAETCAVTDSVESAHALLQRCRVHRAPVIDDRGRLVGIVSLADLVQLADAARGAERARAAQEVLQTLAAVTEPRTPRERLTVLPANPPAAAETAVRTAPASTKRARKSAAEKTTTATRKAKATKAKAKTAKKTTRAKR